MKRIALIIILFVFTMSSTIAQPGRGNFSPEDMADRQTARMAEKIDFTDIQEEKVYELNLKYSKKVVKLRKEMRGSGGWQGMRDKMDTLNEDKDKEMKGILTKDQWGDYLEYKKEQNERRKQMGRQRGNR